MNRSKVMTLILVCGIAVAGIGSNGCPPGTAASVVSAEQAFCAFNKMEDPNLPAGTAQEIGQYIATACNFAPTATSWIIDLISAFSSSGADSAMPSAARANLTAKLKR